MRPIVNFWSKINLSGHPQLLSVNDQLRDVFHVLNYEKVREKREGLRYYLSLDLVACTYLRDYFVVDGRNKVYGYLSTIYIDCNQECTAVIDTQRRLVTI